MGAHHARVYASRSDADLVGVADPDLERARSVAETAGATAFPSAEALAAAHPCLAAVSVTTPTAHHETVAIPFLEKGIACLVEKPLAESATAARRLAERAETLGVVLQVGHTERFNPAVRAVLEMGIEPRFLEVDRVSPMSFRSLDVGVVMDMMIHDLDIVATLARSPIHEVQATGVAILGAGEDLANARLVFQSGCVANLTASRLALKTERKLRLFSEDGYVSLDYQKRNGTLIRRSDNAEALADLRGRLAEGSDLSQLDYARLVNVERLAMDPDNGDDPLTAELASFLAAARGGEAPRVTGREGADAVATAERVAGAIEAHTWSGLDRRRP